VYRRQSPDHFRISIKQCNREITQMQWVFYKEIEKEKVFTDQ